MKRHVVPGETIPLEHFPEVMKTHARRIGGYAVARRVAVPVEVEELLAATTEDLRTVQLCRLLTYAEVEAWMGRLASASER